MNAGSDHKPLKVRGVDMTVESEPGDVRRCERVMVTKVVVLAGRGEQGSPVREITYFYDDDGWMIAKRDGWLENRDPPGSGPLGF